MKPAQALLASLVIATLSVGAQADALSEAAGRYRIDESSSRVAFVVSQVGGGGISGDFAKFSGTFFLSSPDLSRSTVEITLFPGSVRTGEPRVENFLRSNAVFDTARYPEITFRSTAVTRTGANAARIDGLLTARGKTAPVSFAAGLLERDKSSITFAVRGKILRTSYGMAVGTPIYSNVAEFDMLLHGRRL